MAALANQTLTIAMYCVAGYVWNTPAKDGGVYWHSKGSYMIKEMGSQLPNLEFRLMGSPSRPASFASVYDALVEGEVDMVTERAFTSTRYHGIIDLAYPEISFDSNMVVISASQPPSVGSEPFKVFDTPSSILLGITFVMFMMTISVIQGVHVTASPKLVQDRSGKAVAAFGMLLRQDLVTTNNKTLGMTIVIGCCSMASLFLTSMYCAVIVSMISVPQQPRYPETLYDLAHEFYGTKMLVLEHVKPQMLKGIPYAAKLESQMINRAPYVEETMEIREEMMRKVMEEQHVILEFRANLDYLYESTSTEFKCKYPIERVHFGSQPVLRFLLAIPMAKTEVAQQFKKLFDQHLLWLDAFGLRNEIRDNGGIYDGQNTEPCSDSGGDLFDKGSCPYSKEEDKSIRLASFGSILFVLAGGLTLSFLAFVLELLLG